MPKTARAKKTPPKKEWSTLQKMRHSASHVLAMAVLRLRPGAKLGIGPAIEEGFYYDFDLPEPLTNDDLPKLESFMREIIKADYKFEHLKLPRKEAEQRLKDQPYKLELLADIPDDPVSFYQSGDFIDLCIGPHVPSTGKIGPVKLLAIAGAYWKGSEKNRMLTRIYGTAFETQSALDDYLKRRAEAEKRDHRKLGREVGLFMFDDTAPGMPYWLPKGVVVLNELIKFWREEHSARGYQEIKSPLINKKELFETSGHWEHYREQMFIADMGEEGLYALKPMNCPNAMVVFGSRPRSYRELPLRLSDTDTLHRFERSGTLNGLLRVREFSQDDSHNFVTEDQIKSEYQEILDIADRFYSVFDIKYRLRLSTRPDDFMGDPKLWDRAEKALEEILQKSGKEYLVLPKDGAFYGPKIDILMEDSLGREWQTGTIQLDFQLPRRFDLKYTDADGKEKTPAVIHRVIYGSLERFLGILIEHTAGAFPTWLSPVQVVIAPIADRNAKYAQKVNEELKMMNVRTEVDERNESIGKKIRDAELQKVPYILVVGEREEKEKKVAVRKRGKGDVGAIDLKKFSTELVDEIRSRK